VEKVERKERGLEDVTHHMRGMQMMPIIPGAGVISLGGIILIAGFLWKIWRNDLRHISKALDRVESSQTRIETKIDNHISSHAKGDFGG